MARIDADAGRAERLPVHPLRRHATGGGTKPQENEAQKKCAGAVPNGVTPALFPPEQVEP